MGGETGSAIDRPVYMFDVDGTLCESQQIVKDSMIAVLLKLSEFGDIGVVSGSNADKVLNEFQVKSKEELRDRCGIRYCMFENGALSYDLCTNTTLHEGNIVDYLGEDGYQSVVNFILRKLSEIRLPVKRDLMIETRRGNINICPVGRWCSYEERLQFHEFDKVHKIREKLAEDLNSTFGSGSKPLVCNLGGQISCDLSPVNWTKRMVVDLLPDRRLIFFGDNCGPGGNDSPLYTALHPASYWVSGPTDCVEKIKALFPDGTF